MSALATPSHCYSSFLNLLPGLRPPALSSSIRTKGAFKTAPGKEEEPVLLGLDDREPLEPLESFEVEGRKRPKRRPGVVVNIVSIFLGRVLGEGGRVIIIDKEALKRPILASTEIHIQTSMRFPRLIDWVDHDSLGDSNNGDDADAAHSQAGQYFSVPRSIA